MMHQWNPGSLLGTSTSYWRGCTLHAGVRLQIFSFIDDELLAVDAVAKAIGADERATGLLLDALVAMGLLVKENRCYGNSEASSKFLRISSPAYMGHILLHHHHLIDGWAQLDQAVRTGNPVKKRSYGEEVERESFLMGMFNLAMGLAPTIVSQLDLTGKKRLLDLGGGPGTYAIHFCMANPDMQAVIFDRPTSEPFARKTTQSFGVEDRISFKGGDFITDPISGGPFDVAWLSHILHSNSPEHCQLLINKTVEAMEPGGLILIHDFILDNSKHSPEFPALFSLNMLIANGHGRSYSEQEIITMLQNAGVGQIQRHAFCSHNDSAILLGTRTG